MNLTFKKGEAIYHPFYGQVFVEEPAICNEAVRIRGKGFIHVNNLSFEPWPAPVHVRPMKVGWYVGWFNCCANPVLFYYDGLIYKSGPNWINGRSTLSENPKMKYLGKEMKHD